MELVVKGKLPRATGLPLVDDWDCLRVRDLLSLLVAPRRQREQTWMSREGSVGKVSGPTVENVTRSLQGMMDVWTEHCGMDQYAMQVSRTFANLCNSGVPLTAVSEAAAAHCSVALATS